MQDNNNHLLQCSKSNINNKGNHNHNRNHSSNKLRKSYLKS